MPLKVKLKKIKFFASVRIFKSIFLTAHLSINQHIFFSQDRQDYIIYKQREGLQRSLGSIVILDVFAFLAPALIFTLRRRIILHLRVVSLLIFLCHFVETLLLDVRHSLRHIRYSVHVALAFLHGWSHSHVR